jgi:MarR family transcriptional regulator, 2-MHQ and catechol-resistance regulon repressor
MKIEEAINTKFISEQQKAIVNIRYTSNWLSNIQNSFMKQFDLTMPQFNVLRILRGANIPLNIQTIKNRMVEKSPNSTRLLDKLEAKKFILRTNDSEDKRAIMVSITKEGLGVLKSIDKELKEKDFFNISLSDNEAETLSDLLDKLRLGVNQ